MFVCVFSLVLLVMCYLCLVVYFSCDVRLNLFISFIVVVSIRFVFKRYNDVYTFIFVLIFLFFYKTITLLKKVLFREKDAR